MKVFHKLLCLSCVFLLMFTGISSAKVPSMKELISQLVATDDQIRNNAEATILGLGDEAIPALADVLYHPETHTHILRGNVARMLGRIADANTLPALIYAATNDQDPFVRSSAVGSIEKVKVATPEAIVALRSCLLDKDPNTQLAAANALRALGRAASDATIDLLLLTGSSDAQLAWAGQRGAMTISPGIFPLKEDTIMQIVNRLPDLKWQSLAITVLSRNAGDLEPVKEIVLDPQASTMLRVPGLQVLAKAGVNDQQLLQQVINLVATGKEPFLIKVAVANFLQTVDLSAVSHLEAQAKEVISQNPLRQYLADGQIPMQVENYATHDRKNVFVQALVGFPVSLSVTNDTEITVVDEDGSAVYTEFEPITYWDQEQTLARSAVVTFYPELNALQRSVYFVATTQAKSNLAKPETVDTAGRIRVSVPQHGFNVISDIEFALPDGWLQQIIVAADGTGHYTTMQAAVDAVPDNNDERILIYVKNGVYHEKLIFPADKSAISLFGEDKFEAVLQFNEVPTVRHSPEDIFNTYGSASTIVLSDDFTAENITFHNSSGPGTGQALVINVQGDRSIFTNARFVSNQDTIFLNTTGRAYFYNNYIEGDVDFIYGPATAVFENCDIVNNRKTGGYVTAASTPEEQEFGFVFINSRIIGDVNQGSVWLGRPWRPFAHVAFINCYMSEVVQRTGWHNWGNAANEATARYEEYQSYGPGANPNGRITWSRQLTDAEATSYTLENILKGDDNWLPMVKK